jgi:hypothetical protein
MTQEKHDTTALVQLALQNGWDYAQLLRVARELAQPTAPKNGSGDRIPYREPYGIYGGYANPEQHD